MSRNPDPLDQAMQAGVRLELPEADYMFGEGPLTLDVDGFGDVAQYWGIIWIEVRGREIFEHGSRPRTVAVRLSALARS
jgi:hypothetical protein